eukprot:gene12262-biopygen7927
MPRGVQVGGGLAEAESVVALLFRGSGHATRPRGRALVPEELRDGVSRGPPAKLRSTRVHASLPAHSVLRRLQSGPPLGAGGPHAFAAAELVPL